MAQQTKVPAFKAISGLSTKLPGWRLGAGWTASGGRPNPAAGVVWPRGGRGK